MKLIDLAFVLDILKENGYGNVEIYTHWEDFKDKFPKQPEFHLYLNGMNEEDFKRIWEQNPFPAGVEFKTFSISKECSIHENKVKLDNCYDVWNRCMATRKYMGLEE